MPLLLAFPAIALAASTPPDPSKPSPGVSGQVSETGGYSATVPLGLPAPRGDLPVPVALVYNNSSTVHEGGIGWNIPFSYVRQYSTVSQHKPKFASTSSTTPSSPPTEVAIRTVLDLGGGQMLMSEFYDSYRPIVGGGVELRHMPDDTWQALDSTGHVYVFTSIPALKDKTLWLLSEIRDRTGENKVTLSYAVEQAVFPDAPPSSFRSVELMLTDVKYSFSKSGCPKHHVQLNYRTGNELNKDIPYGAVLAYYTSNGAPRVRTKLLESVVTWVRSDAACSAPPVRLKTVRLGYSVAPETRQPLLATADVWGQGDPASDAGKSRPIARFQYGSALTNGNLLVGDAHFMQLPGPPVLGNLLSTMWGWAYYCGGQLGDDDDPLWLCPWSGVMQSLRDVTGDNRADLLYTPDWIYEADPGHGIQLAKSVVGPTGHEFDTPKNFWDLGSIGALTPVGFLVSPFGGKWLDSFNFSGYYDDDSGVDAGSTHAIRQLMDWNGDGRLDVLSSPAWGISEDEADSRWWIMLNTPGTNPSDIVWKATDVDIRPLAEEVKSHLHLEWDGHWTQLMLERKMTRNECWEEHQGSVFYPTCDDETGPTFKRKHNDYQTVTEWKLLDANSDGLPDFVFSTPSMEMDGSIAHEVRVVYNRGAFRPFDGASVVLHQTTCGVERIRGYDASIDESVDPKKVPKITYLSCGFLDVNGDGLLDYIDEDDRETRPPSMNKPPQVRVYLGTGLPGDFKKERSFMLPAPSNVVEDFKRDGCEGAPDSTTLASHEWSSLLDMTGDGIPDFVYHGARNRIDGGIPVRGVAPEAGTAPRWWVIPGTGVGFAQPVLLDAGYHPATVPGQFDADFEFQLNRSVRTCHDNASTNTMGMVADLDGDGLPESVCAGTRCGNQNPSNQQLRVTSLVTRKFGREITRGAPAAMRLVAIDNGYGGVTRIHWGNAKYEKQTSHNVPEPEIVVMAVDHIATRGLGAYLAPTYYAYGDAQHVYSPLVDRWHFAGYARTATLSGVPHESTANTVVGTVEVVDYVRPADVPSTASLHRMALVGRVRETNVLDGNFTADPGALLSLNTSGSDTRLHSGTAQRWAHVYQFEPGNGLDDNCVGYRGVPFNGPNSDEWMFDHSGIELCHSQLIPYAEEQFAWEGATKPTFGSASPTAVQTYTKVRHVDYYGRALLVENHNDVATTSDDLCISYVYAISLRTDMLVRDAIASERVLDCKNMAPIAGTQFRYDGLNGEGQEGQADRGLLTDVIQEVYEGTTLKSSRASRLIAYDTYGNESEVGLWNWRPDALLPLVTIKSKKYDQAFAVALEAETFLGLGTPSITTTIERDPVNLAPSVIHKPNGEIYKHQFDGFGRLYRSSVIHGEGPEYLLSETSYHDGPGDAQGLRVSLRAFDADTTLSTSNPASTQSTFFYDEFGRTRYQRSDLGSDYGNRALYSQYVVRNAAGRVVWRAEPFQTNDIENVTAGSLYGSSFHFYPDGRLQCVIQGVGIQPLDTTTAPSEDRYPTCYAVTYINSQLVSRRAGPNEMLAGDVRYGILDEVRHSATGQVTAKTRVKGTEVLERVHFMHDPLGNVSLMSRFGKPNTFGDVSAWQFTHDSLGRVITSSEPGQAVKHFAYDSHSNLVSATWPDASGQIKGVALRHDELGRLVEQVETFDGAELDASRATFHYDAPADTPHHVAPTHLLGRLSWAENASMRTYFGYDRAGHTTSVAYVNASENIPYVERRAYSSHGELEEIGFELPDSPAPEAVRYVYDSARRVRSVDWVDSRGSEALFTATELDDFGRYRGVSYANGVTATWDYRPDRRHELQNESLTAQNGLRFRYHGAPDGEGRAASRKEASVTNGVHGFMTTAHQYDALNRLARSTTKDLGVAKLDESFTYDPLGNLTKVEDHVGSRDLAFSADPLDRDRLCQSWNPYTDPTPAACDHIYDEVGNAIATDNADAVARRFTYNALGEVLTITKETAAAAFSYDAFGGIVEVNVTGSAQNDNRRDRRYGGLIERSSYQNAELIERKIMGPLGLLARRRGTGASAITLYQHDDGAGGRYFTDENGLIVQEVEYGPFGERFAETGVQPGDVRYTKELWNFGDTLRDFGVTHLGARLYDPQLRRFLQRDPLLVVRTASKMNPYSFAFNDPVNFSDVTGLDPEVLPNREDIDSSNLEFEFYVPGQKAYGGWQYVGHFRVKGTDDIRPGYVPTTPTSESDAEKVRLAAPSDGPTRGKNESRTTYEWLSDAFTGFENAGKGMVGGILSAIMDPEAAANGIWGAVTDPVGTADAILTSMADTIEKVANGDPEAIGGLFFDGVSSLAGGAVFKSVGKMGGAAKYLDNLPVPCGRCFVAGTLVHTEDGPVPIEEVTPGMLVLSRNNQTGEESYRPVLQVFVRMDQPTVLVEAIGEDGTTTSIETTYDHPFYTGRGWVRAANLSLEDILSTRDAGWLRVADVHQEHGSTAVYNFEVAEDHTYFVASAGVWVHNSPCKWVPNPGGKLGKPATRAQVKAIADEMESRGWKIEFGGGGAEEYLTGAGPGTRGSAYPDITASKDGKRLRINTVDTLADGVTPNARESRNAARIRNLKPGDKLLLVPKAK